VTKSEASQTTPNENTITVAAIGTVKSQAQCQHNGLERRVQCRE